LSERKRFSFERIRENQGSPRIHWGDRLSAASEAVVREAIDLAEARSQCFRELCGDEGRRESCGERGRLYGGGWLTTRCAAHAGGGSRSQSRRGTTFKWSSNLLLQVTRQRRWRRYDRETDTLTEVSHPSAEDE
jgi:hypothetical protein